MRMAVPMAKGGGIAYLDSLDCFVAALLAMTATR
jgi:hypothetical protein